MSTPDLLTELLKSVSRSFYLTLRVLPARIRPQISLAYLLARATDTIADTALVPVDERLAVLGQLKGRILGANPQPLRLEAFTRSAPAGPAAAAEAILLTRIEEAIALLSGFDPSDQQRIRDVLGIITSGQELDLRRFGLVQAGQPPVPLETDVELDDYTYRVAGCVGEFWTRMCCSHLFPQASLDECSLLANGVRFGKGLQLVNILRDLPRDLRLGRCYVPARELAACGLGAADLLDPANEAKFRPVYDRWLQVAREHLAAGWAYTNALPANAWRVRLACAWPILIGLRTLDLLRGPGVLDPQHYIRVAQMEVWRIMAASMLLLPFPSAWRRLGQ